MIDAIQQSAIELTVLASDLQSLAFKNANQIAELLTTARPLIRQIPVLGSLADSRAMERAEGLSRIILSSTEGARGVIHDLQESLIKADPKYLKAHLEDLKRYRAEVNQMLVGGRAE